MPKVIVYILLCLLVHYRLVCYRPCYKSRTKRNDCGGFVVSFVNLIPFCGRYMKSELVDGRTFCPCVCVAIRPLVEGKILDAEDTFHSPDT